jgi:alpha-1,3-mannosyltransferase
METYVSNLCQQLTLRGHRSDVATLNYLFKTGQRLSPHQCIGGTDVILLPSAGNPRYFFAPRLLELVPRYDIIHIHGVDFFVDLMGTLRRRHGVPIVLSTHGGYFHTAWHSTFKKIYFQTATRMSLRGVDRVIASSPQDEQLFSRVSRRVTLVENGIDYPTFAAVDNQPDDGTMLFIGRLSKNKRVDRLIKALALVKKQEPRARLQIIGPDWDGLGDGLMRLAGELGLDDSVTITGRLTQQEMLAALSRARLFVSASEYEAFGLSAMEAMASGTVPVLSRIPAFEGFIDDGENGFLTDYADEAMAGRTLAAALALSDERLGRIGEQARQTASRYDWAQVAGQIEEVYEQVVAGA